VVAAVLVAVAIVLVVDIVWMGLMGLVSFLNAIDRTRMERTGAQFYADWYRCGPSIEDSLPDVASRLARHSFPEFGRRSDVGSFRRRGEVGRTTTRTITRDFFTRYRLPDTAQRFLQR
jgi:hypothetical protein